MRWLRLVRLGVHLFWGLLTIACAYPLLQDRRRLQLKQRWSRQLLEMLGIRVDANLSRGAQGHLIVANHISWLDVFALNATRPMAFVAKAEVRNWPVIGWMAAKTDTIFLQRGRRSKALEINADIAGLLAAGKDVAVFPEGTTTDGSTVLPFFGALMQPAIDIRHEVHPVSIAYFDEAGKPCLAPVYAGETTMIHSLAAIISTPHITVHLSQTPAIAPNESTSRRILADMARGAIAFSLGISLSDRATLRHDPPGPSLPERVESPLYCGEMREQA